MTALSRTASASLAASSAFTTSAFMLLLFSWSSVASFFAYREILSPC